MSSIRIVGCPEELRAGVAAVQKEFPERFGKSGACAVTFDKVHEAFSPSVWVEKTGGAATIRYRRMIDAFRSLGILMGSETAALRHREAARFEMLGVMIDVSRNAVVKPEAVRQLLVRYALMGVNALMLYAEDTYEVHGEPFFGYLRGRYTPAEMKALDHFASALGVEMFPCIQTLGHLGQILQWPAYADRRDTRDVLIADEEETYLLIEKMIRAASSPFKSSRIHIGMDEAHGVATGRYREMHGVKRPFDVLNAHLAHVLAICRHQKLRPMIWSDMYFRLGSKTGGYYDRESIVPKDVIRHIPKDVQLVYWDYYHAERAFYEDFIDRHRSLGHEPVMAGGVWTWNRFWTHMPHTVSTTDACMAACKRKGLREAFTTLWGDDGAECDLFSALPGVQYFAEHGYQDNVDIDRLRANFRGSCGADWDDWAAAGRLDVLPGGVGDEALDCPNTTKAILFQDPFLAIIDPQVDGLPLKEHYAKMAKTLDAAAKKGGMAARLKFPMLIARAVSLKADLRRDLARAYAKKDKAALKRVASKDLAALLRAVNALWRAHREMWLAAHKPFGLEVIETRYGGLLARLESLADRLKQYTAGEIDEIPELGEKMELIWHPAKQLPVVNYDRVATPSAIK